FAKANVALAMTVMWSWPRKRQATVAAAAPGSAVAPPDASELPTMAIWLPTVLPPVYPLQQPLSRIQERSVLALQEGGSLVAKYRLDWRLAKGGMGSVGGARRIAARAIGAAVLLGAFLARAEPAKRDPVAAEAIFRAGRDLLAQGNYAEACPKFEASFALDP